MEVRVVEFLLHLLPDVAEHVFALSLGLELEVAREADLLGLAARERHFGDAAAGEDVDSTAVRGGRDAARDAAGQHFHAALAQVFHAEALPAFERGHVV